MSVNKKINYKDLKRPLCIKDLNNDKDKILMVFKSLNLDMDRCNNFITNCTVKQLYICGGSITYSHNNSYIDNLGEFQYYSYDDIDWEDAVCLVDYSKKLDYTAIGYKSNSKSHIALALEIPEHVRKDIDKISSLFETKPEKITLPEFKYNNIFKGE